MAHPAASLPAKHIYVILIVLISWTKYQDINNT